MSATGSDARALRALLKALGRLPIAALLRELGAELYNREIRAWRVLVDISDELIDAEMLAARERIVEHALDRKPPAVLPPRTPLAEARRLKRRKRA